ncbi:hypothetical protein SBRCBS47491_006985 [Sporothrix bragantina]|uniref:Kinetochore protein fta7 n=1 Tax=Sporothrix bragantina TaxID=671064 RepID=A0ABP0C9G2_9PEZI
MARINTSLGGGQADAPSTTGASPASAPTRKRGRKAKAEVEDARPTKRARKSAEVESEPRRSRRDRGSADGSSRSKSEGKRGRPERQSPTSAKTSNPKSEKAKKTTKAAKQPAPAPEDEQPKRKAGRPRKSDASQPGAPAEAPTDAAEASQKTSTRGRKSGKSRKTTEEAVAAKAASPSSRLKGKRGRKPKQPTAGDAQEVTAEAEEEPEPEPDAEAEAGEEGEDDNVMRRRRQSSGPSDGNADPPFRQLVPRTRMVPMATMANKWAPLERDAIAAVHALMEECARPVIARVRAAGSGGGGAANERQQEQTRQAISSVTRRLRSKLVKGIPFPPGTVVVSSRRGRRSTKGQDDNISSGLEADFNYESAAEGALALEQQLTPIQHAIALLERERKCEEAALEADYAKLRELETNAQVDLRTWRERARKAHVLAPVDADTGNGDHSNKNLLQVELVVRAPASDENNEKDENDQQSGGLFENLSKDLSTTAAQLSSHMDSMKANLQQIDGVVPAIIQSKAALQHVLHERLDPLQYERILLGL